MKRKVQGIIYDIVEGVTYYLIFHRILNWKGWELMKETLEEGETHEEAIVRGIEEETSLKKYKIINAFEVNIKTDVISIEKVFLIKADKEERVDLKQKIIEHDAYKWVTKEEALALLTFDNAKELVKNTEIIP